MQNIDDIYGIIASVLSDNAGTAEQAALAAWRSENDSNESLFQELKALWSVDTEIDLPQPNTAKMWQQIEGRLETNTEKSEKKKGRSNVRRLWPALAIAAALAALVISRINFPKDPASIIFETQQIAQSTVLPDGSELWLKPNSRIEYVEGFSPRTVRLEGEAFFNVTSDPSAPFVVQTDQLETRVLGTQFTISASDSSAHRVSLLEGSVSVQLADKTETVLLQPGESVVQSQQSLVKETSPLTNELSWISNELSFDNTKLKNVLKDICKHYNVKLLADKSQDYMNCSFTGTFPKAPIEDILQTLEFTLKLEYTLDNNQLEILDANCD